LEKSSPYRKRKYVVLLAFPNGLEVDVTGITQSGSEKETFDEPVAEIQKLFHSGKSAGPSDVFTRSPQSTLATPFGVRALLSSSYPLWKVQT
jgi:hypothetical protein